MYGMWKAFLWKKMHGMFQKGNKSKQTSHKNKTKNKTEEV